MIPEKIQYKIDEANRLIKYTQEITKALTTMPYPVNIACVYALARTHYEIELEIHLKYVMKQREVVE